MTTVAYNCHRTSEQKKNFVWTITITTWDSIYPLWFRQCDFVNPRNNLYKYIQSINKRLKRHWEAWVSKLAGEKVRYIFPR